MQDLHDLLCVHMFSKYKPQIIWTSIALLEITFPKWYSTSAGGGVGALI